MLTDSQEHFWGMVTLNNVHYNYAV